MEVLSISNQSSLYPGLPWSALVPRGAPITDHQTGPITANKYQGVLSNIIMRSVDSGRQSSDWQDSCLGQKLMGPITVSIVTPSVTLIRTCVVISPSSPISLWRTWRHQPGQPVVIRV